MRRLHHHTVPGATPQVPTQALPFSTPTSLRVEGPVSTSSRLLTQASSHTRLQALGQRQA